MVVPVATAQQLTRSFRTTLVAAMVLGIAASRRRAAARGVRVLRTRTVAPGPTIVLLALAGFAVDLAARGLAAPPGAGCARRSRPVDRADEHQTPTEHPHEHGQDCGHVAVEHGDHVDYVHDGHRHAVPHGEHYDEH